MDFLGDIDWAVVGRVLAGLAPALTVAVGLTRGPGAIRARLKHDVEVLAMLPNESASRAAMEEYVTIQIGRLKNFETEAERNWSDAILSLAVVLGLLFGALYLFGRDHWAWDALAWTVVLIAAAGLSSTYDSIKRVPRDEKGKPL